MSGLSDKESSVSGGDVYQAMFVALKLGHQVDWSWWVVLIPTWVTLGMLVITGFVKEWRKK